MRRGRPAIKNRAEGLRATLRTREDGLAIDQIVLAADRYRTPGALFADTTILPLR